jgi:CRISPR system Cascade subunit CasA
MAKPNDHAPSFNLWTEPWIALETTDGAIKQVSIRDALVYAHEYVTIYDSSPLVVVGVHRLLTAILQDALNPQENSDLEDLWARGKFPEDKIKKFGDDYADRFDLFSQDKPFMQSADLAMFPQTKEALKEKTTVARLFPETPSGTLITHYRHGTEDDQIFAPASVAKGLAAMPPFISSGGPGLMPSINGVPPIYVLPGGKTLFEMLAASLIAQTTLGDEYATRRGDRAWWKRDVPVRVQESKKKTATMSARESNQLSEVGYLHGLTFPARKVRLHPEWLDATCSRSGQLSEWCVRTMAFRMGESRLEDAPMWYDPFVAYKLPVKPKADAKRKSKPAQTRKAKEKPNPIRPNLNRGKVAWREFSGLFLQHQDDGYQRPRFLNQFSALTASGQFQTYPFRCVALQTDGKMKFFEWIDFGFDVPPALLQDPQGADWTEQALAFATECAGKITYVFASTFGGKVKKAERFKRLKARMESDYWSALAGAFRQFVLELGEPTTRQQILGAWYDTVVREAQKAFDDAADATGDDGNTLGHIVQGKAKCKSELNILRSQFKKGANDAST